MWACKQLLRSVAAWVNVVTFPRKLAGWYSHHAYHRITNWSQDHKGTSRHNCEDGWWPRPVDAKVRPMEGHWNLLVGGAVCKELQSQMPAEDHYRRDTQPVAVLGKKITSQESRHYQIWLQEVLLDNRPPCYVEEDVQLPLLTMNMLKFGRPNFLPDPKAPWSSTFTTSVVSFNLLTIDK